MVVRGRSPATASVGSCSMTPMRAASDAVAPRWGAGHRGKVAAQSHPTATARSGCGCREPGAPRDPHQAGLPRHRAPLPPRSVGGGRTCGKPQFPAGVLNVRSCHTTGRRGYASVHPAPQTPLAGLEVEPDVPTVAAGVLHDPANATPPLRRATRPGILNRMGERLAAVVAGRHATFVARAIPWRSPSAAGIAPGRSVMPAG